MSRSLCTRLCRGIAIVSFLALPLLASCTTVVDTTPSKVVVPSATVVTPATTTVVVD